MDGRSAKVLKDRCDVGVSLPSAARFTLMCSLSKSIVKPKAAEFFVIGVSIDIGGQVVAIDAGLPIPPGVTDMVSETVGDADWLMEYLAVISCISDQSFSRMASGRWLSLQLLILLVDNLLISTSWHCPLEDVTLGTLAFVTYCQAPSRRDTSHRQLSPQSRWVLTVFFKYAEGCRCPVPLLKPNHYVQTAHPALDKIDRAGDVTCCMSCCVMCTVYTGNVCILKLRKNRNCIFYSNVSEIDVGMFPDTCSINICSFNNPCFFYLCSYETQMNKCLVTWLWKSVFFMTDVKRYFGHCFFSIILSYSWYPWIINRSSNLRILNFLKMGSVCAINLLLSINRTAFFEV